MPARLALDLARRGMKVEAVNAGVRGYAAGQYPALVEKSLVLRPALLVLVLTVVNDPEIHQWRPSSQRLTAMEKAWWVKLPFAKLLMGPAYAAEINRLWIEHVQKLYDPAGPDWQPFLADLREVKDLCGRADVPLLVVVFPMVGPEVRFAQEEGKLERTLTAVGFDWVSPRAAIDRLPPEKQVVSPQDFHPGPAAAAAAAKMIAERAAKLLR